MLLAPASTPVSCSGSTAVLPANPAGHSRSKAGFVQLMLAQLTTTLRPSRMAAGGPDAEAAVLESRQEFSPTVAAPKAQTAAASAPAAASSQDPPPASTVRIEAAVQNAGGNTTPAQAVVLEAGKEKPVGMIPVRIPRGAAPPGKHQTAGADTGGPVAKIAKNTASANRALPERLSTSPSPAEPNVAGDLNAGVPMAATAAWPAPAVTAPLSAMAEIAAGTGTIPENKSEGHSATPPLGGSAGAIGRDAVHSLAVNGGNAPDEKHPAEQHQAMLAATSYRVAATETGVRTVTAQHFGAPDTAGPAVVPNVRGGALLQHGLSFSAEHTALSTPNPTSTAGTGTAGTSTANTSTAGTSPTVAHNPFERMDAAPAPQVLASNSQRLAVGVRDAGLGWVEVRTHTAAGQISAVVATNSAEAHAAVSAQLPAMREFLAAQHVRVDSLGTQQFTSSSGHEDPSRGNQSGGRSLAEERSDRIRPDTQIVVPEAEEETLSYISIRV